jgi:hypothetical protein
MNNYLIYENKLIDDLDTSVYIGNVFKQNGTTGTLYFGVGAHNMLSYGNTFIGHNGGVYGAVRSNSGAMVFSVNDLFMNETVGTSAIQIGKYGGSCLASNLCAWSDGGQLDNVMTDQFAEGDAPVRLSDIENLIEVDPLLDASNEPLELQVRNGGFSNVLGDTTSIGAIQTMNISVIETIVEEAVAGIGTGVSNIQGELTNSIGPGMTAIQQVVDNIPFSGNDIIATLDGETVTVGNPNDCKADVTAVKLAADGLDAVVVAEPAGAISGWSFVQCLRWLIMRFMNKHTSDNFNGITVHKDDDSVSTTQPVTDASGTKTVGKVQ